MIVRAADSKKIYQIDLIPREKMVALLCGRSRHVHLHSWGALEGAEASIDIKLQETKGCQALTSGQLKPGGPACLLAAVKRQVSPPTEPRSHLIGCLVPQSLDPAPPHIAPVPSSNWPRPLSLILTPPPPVLSF